MPTQPASQGAQIADMPQGQVPAPQPADDGFQGETVTVQGARQMRPPSQRQMLEAQFQAAQQAGDWEEVQRLGGELTGLVTTERTQQQTQAKATYDAIGSWAFGAMDALNRVPPQMRQDQAAWGPIITRQAAALADRMDDMGLDGDIVRSQVRIDPGETFEQVMGELQQMAEMAFADEAGQQRFEPVRPVDLGNRTALLGGTGQVQGYLQQGANPEAVLTAQTQRRGQDVQAQVAAANRASQQTIAQINANVRLSEGEKNRQVQRERTRAAQAIAILTGKIELGDEVGADEFAD
jgi:hypothetical protein